MSGKCSNEMRSVGIWINRSLILTVIFSAGGLWPNGVCQAAGEASLFSDKAPVMQSSQFEASGYSQPACGVIFNKDNPACCGVPMGGVSTGCIDIETSGVWGFNFLFNSYPRPQHVPEFPDFAPRRPQLLEPFLGLHVDGKAYVLATRKVLDGGRVRTCREPAWTDHDWGFVDFDKIEGVECAKEIHYFGHYPVADLQYETDAPLQVSMRGWSCFVPGDLAISSTPGALFEVHVRNETQSAKSATIALSFSGPTVEEAQSEQFERRGVTGDFNGVLVSGKAANYALGVIGPERLRTGGALLRDGAAWAAMDKVLPAPAVAGTESLSSDQSGTSVAIDFELAPEESKVMRFVLAWYSPQWYGLTDRAFTRDYVLGQRDKPLTSRAYTRAYAGRYRDALEVAQRLAREHAAIFKQITAWQEAVYGANDLPVWLREALVNNLSLIPEVSYWALPQSPLGDWSFPMGVFSMIESPRGCPQMSCIPCDWYGNLPIIYFFPELAAANLRPYVAYMLDSGAVPMCFGRNEDIADPTAIPYIYQETLNGCCFVAMVGRLWQREGDDKTLREFYEAAKKSTIFTMNLL